MDVSSGELPSGPATATHKRGQKRDNSDQRGSKVGCGRRKEMGRTDWSKSKGDRRSRNNAEAEKRRKLDDGTRERPIYAVDFSKEEIENEERRPKRKVAVMIGYSGSGYKGMQLNDKSKTIEGDLFGAFVAAGAVSKANANDPKKSALVRCARTDKGVHAAGNIISMKLIIEDEDIIQRINDNLSPQIRVWGIERTNSSFSAYQLCDSRIYEYLIPTHCFLPPHPESFLGKRLVELADNAGDRDSYEARQKEVADFWYKTEEQYIQPIISALDPSIQASVLKAIHEPHSERDLVSSGPGVENSTKDESQLSSTTATSEVEQTAEQAVSTKIICKVAGPPSDDLQRNTAMVDREESKYLKPVEGNKELANPKQTSPEENAIKCLKAAYVEAKRAYRIHPDRLARIKSSLSRYLGTRNFHNYTVQKNYHDPSAKRVMKSFILNERPVLINNTEWLSLKVHGQSFMMHQIRKMVSMVALVVRCGCHEGRIQDSYMPEKIIIPKAPGLGLLLERPVFDSYNEKLAVVNERNPIGFEKYEKEMEEFKQREIYERIFREEERDNQFHTMFSNIDNFKSSQLLYLSSIGIAAIKEEFAAEAASVKKVEEAVEGESSDDDENPEDG